MQPDGATGERLQKLIARAGRASRREAERLIIAGRVMVDGTVVTELGFRVDPSRSVVLVDGDQIEWDAPRRYVLLNKPAGYVTTVSDTHGRPTVIELVERFGPGLFPVGRLDLDTEGLLLLTDDGGLANRLTHPRYHVPKTYEARVARMPTERALQRLRTGVELDDGHTAPAEASARETGDGAVITLTLTEGRKRQVKRMCEAVGHPVLALTRVALGPLVSGSLVEGPLAVGEARELTAREIEALRQASSDPSPDAPPGTG